MSLHSRSLSPKQTASVIRVASLLLAMLLPVFALTARATTVIPPDFDSLVQQADYVVRGSVKSVVSDWRIGNGQRQIFTRVEIDVAETIAGTPPVPLVLDMLGGRVGTVEMTVQGSPKFTVGEEYILFIRGNGVQFNPLVALMHGQYPIKKDALSGRRQMARSDGSPLRDEKEVSLPMHAAHDDTAAASSTASATAQAAPAATPALTPEEFATRIRASREKAAAAK